jgi:hypothetical protein
MFDNFFYLSPLLAMLICLSSFFRYRRLAIQFKSLIVDFRNIESQFNKLVEFRKIEQAQFKAAMQDRLDLCDDFDDDDDLSWLDDGFDDYDGFDLDFDEEPKPKPKQLPKPKPKRLPLLRR